YFLGWTLTKKHLASLVAGLLFGFVTYKWGHIQHLQIVWSGCAALLLAGVVRYRRAPTVGNAALVAASLAANVLMNLYLFLFCAVALVLSLALIALAEWHDARFWLRLGVALAIAGLLVTPILMPYWIVSKKYALQREEGDSLGGSATPTEWLIANGRSLLYAGITD